MSDVFEDKFGDKLYVIPHPKRDDDSVSILIDIKGQENEAWLDPDVAMDVAAAIVRAVHGDPP